MQHVNSGQEMPNNSSLQRLRTRVGKFHVAEKTLLIPNMAPFPCRLLAASFRAMGVNAVLMETYKGLHLGKQHTSGKECFPCQITLGDVLVHLQEEKERLGEAFRGENYAYFMPEAGGPCRFGMYNKLHRLVLDQFEDFQDVPIVYLSSENSYRTADIMAPEKASVFRKLSYTAIVVADILDRTVWRVRPYELRPGLTDQFMETALQAMENVIFESGTEPDYERIYNLLEDIVATTASFMDPDAPRRPRIGVVGEIYLRTHPDSNQNIIRQLEQCGAEVVDASLAEWINYVTFDRGRKLRHTWNRAWLGKDHETLRLTSKQLLANKIEDLYQKWRQGKAYNRALRHLDIQKDHSIGDIERQLQKDRLFNFDIGTEAALSIGGALEYVHEGFDGIVNVFPFTCMPSTVCASVLKPLLHEMRIPYLDAPYDGTMQGNREIALRTFVHQAKQHLRHRAAKTKTRQTHDSTNHDHQRRPS